jgi:hypothetical protein
MITIFQALEAEVSSPTQVFMPKEQARLWVLHQAIAQGGVSLSGLLESRPPLGFKLSRPLASMCLNELTPLLEPSSQRQHSRGRARTVWRVREEHKERVAKLTQQWQYNINRIKNG